MMADASSQYIIPVNLQAIRVADSDTDKFKGPSTNLDKATEGLGWNMNNPLGSSSSPINAGIHLHWALPDALTHGKQFPNGDVLFPAAPNRWLVTRYYSEFNTQININSPAANGAPSAPKVAQWIVESNVLASNPGHNSTSIYKLDPGAGAPLRLEGGTTLPPNLSELPTIDQAQLGDWSTYNSSWKDQQLNGGNSAQDYLPSLTAIDHYGPGFAAYYQNSLTVFGFFDDFKDIIDEHNQTGTGWINLNDKDANFNVSYQVVGWYSEASKNDILVKTLAEAKMAYSAQSQTDSELAFFYDFVAKELKWQFNANGQDPITGNWPHSVASLYNGAALNVQWLIQETPSPHNPEFLPCPTKVGDTFNLEIAIGNNTSEALSTMIAKGSIKDVNTADGATTTAEPFPNLEAHLEFLFNAFQQGLLRKLASTEPDLRLPELEEYLHTARFSSHKGGNIWNLRLEPNQGTDKPDTVQVEAQLPLAVAEMLSYLNANQKSYDAQSAALKSRQHQAFLDWTNLGLSDQSTSDAQSTIVSDLNSSNTCNTSSNDADVWDYLTSELLQLYTQSSKTGFLNHDSKSGEKAGDLSFESVWTNLNNKTEAYCLSLADAQSQLLVLLPSVLKEVLQKLKKALATLVGGGSAGAINTLKQLAQQPLATKLNQLQQLTQVNNNAALDQLDNGLVDLTQNQQLFTNVLQSSVGDKPGLLAIKNAYEQSPFSGHQAIQKFVSGWEADLFTTANLLDGQEIYVLAEAANYYNFNEQVVSAELLSAIAETEQRLASIKTLISKIATIKTSLHACFKQTYNVLTSINVNIKQVVSLLTNNQESPIAAIQCLTQTIELIADSLIDNKKIDSASQGLQAVWMSLLNYLPSGHRVTILAKVMTLISAQLDEKLSLVTTPAQAFFAPNNPVLLMTEPKGVDTKNVLEPVNRNGRAGVVPCRLPVDLITTMQLNGKAINSDILDNKTQVAKVFNNIGNRMTTVQALLYEAYLIVPQAAYDLLVNAVNLSANNLENFIVLQASVVSSIKADQEYLKTPPVENNASFKGEDVTVDFTGTMPYYIGMTWFGDFSFNPFLPLYMAWSASYTPVQLGSNGSQNGGVFPEDYLTSNFTIGDTAEDRHVDLVCKHPMPLSTQNGNQQVELPLSGQITLTSRATAPLLQQIKVFFLNALGKDITQGEISSADLKNELQKDLFNTYEYFDKKVILSQAMSGFNEQLIQQFFELSLPLNEKVNTAQSESGKLFQFLLPYLNYPQFDQTTVGGNTATSDFLPFRAGTMTVDNIYIVDAFGRYFEMKNVQDNLCRAASMSLPEACANSGFPDIDKQIYLPPRVIQPSRLSFNWLSAESLQGSDTTFIEHTQQAAASPICGWLFPNHLDKGLTIYDSGGKALGGLNVEGAMQTTTWNGVPAAGLENLSTSGGDNGREEMLTAITGANTVLQNFLTEFAFPKIAKGAYNSLLNVMQTAQSYTNLGGLQNDKGLAVLIGQPLVLVRASIRLDLQGLPSVALDMDSLCSSIRKFFNITAGDISNPVIDSGRGYDLNQRFKGNFTDISIPVMLGDLMQFNDGLVGYFVNNDWSTFYSPASKANLGSVQQATFETLKLGFNYEGQRDPANEIQLIMIMDPRAAVHATTGILPVKKITIPPSQYLDVMNSLLTYFLTNPVLLGNSADRIDFGNLPLPKEKEHDWLWTQPGLAADVPLHRNFAGDRAHFDFSPQQILDGWLKLQKTK